jgi:hypothetical protein
VTFGADNPALCEFVIKLCPVTAVFVIIIFNTVGVIVEQFGRSLTIFASLPHLVVAFFKKINSFSSP